MHIYTILKVWNTTLKHSVMAVLLLVCGVVHAQLDSVRYDVTLTELTSTGDYAPFWMQNRQYGKISSAPVSAGLLMGVYKDYGSKHKKFDYGFKVNALVRTDKAGSEFYFHELYAKVRYSVLDLVVGAREEQYGNQDSSLSCGGFLFSQSARPMPKVYVGIEHFTPVPYTKGYLEVKGGLSHGWFTDNTYATGVLLHHKYMYLKAGGRLPIHLQYGLEHVAQWGGNIPGLGVQPHGIGDYFSIFFGLHGGENANLGDQINALGNHIFSQNLRLDMDISDFKLGAYWQNINEDGPVRFIGNTMNAADGLWGISIRNNRFHFVKGFLYEYMNSTDQSGPFHDKDGIVYGGADTYFYNYVYQSGWSYFARTIGTPLITSPLYNKNGVVHTLNNRVQAHHVGVEGDIYQFGYRILGTISKNYGTYGVSESLMKRSTSLLLEVNRYFPKLAGVELGCTVGADWGTMYGRSVGVQFSVRKRGSF